MLAYYVPEFVQCDVRVDGEVEPGSVLGVEVVDDGECDGKRGKLARQGLQASVAALLAFIKNPLKYG